jgi:hypothetical protein
MVEDEVYRTPTPTSLAIDLFASKTFLSHHLFNEDGSKGPIKLLKSEKLNQILNFIPLCSLGICNQIASLKHCFDNSNSLDYILNLKTLFSYNYIHDNCFLGQQTRQKVYLFKIFVNGTTSEFDLVQQMQPDDDLQNAWMMLDHVKHVQGWVTMAYQAYDLIYCKVMTIAIYDMQFKDTKAQCIVWRNLNIIVKKKRLGMPIFKGFLVNNA